MRPVFVVIIQSAGVHLRRTESLRQSSVTPANDSRTAASRKDLNAWSFATEKAIDFEPGRRHVVLFGREVGFTWY